MKDFCYYYSIAYPVVEELFILSLTFVCFENLVL